MLSKLMHVAVLVAGGLANKEIARRLDLSEGTVKIHLHHIYEKVGVNNRTALATLTLTYREELSASVAN